MNLPGFEALWQQVQECPGLLLLFLHVALACAGDSQESSAYTFKNKQSRWQTTFGSTSSLLLSSCPTPSFWECNWSGALFELTGTEREGCHSGYQRELSEGSPPAPDSAGLWSQASSWHTLSTLCFSQWRCASASWQRGLKPISSELAGHGTGWTFLPRGRKLLRACGS